jgi:Putative endonuclease segE, GIY-YIG domain
MMRSWTFEGREVTEADVEGHFGFVYVITNIVDGRRYVGKKLLSRAKTTTVKGRKKRSRVESDWKTYFGSSTELLEDVKKLGEDSFKREIVMFCDSRGLCSYHEARLQFEYGVLLSDRWYNSFIGCKIHASHVRPKKLSRTSPLGKKPARQK